MQLNHFLFAALSFVMSNSTVFIQPLWQKEVMRILIIILFWASCSIAYKNVKDLEASVNECMGRGREIENVREYCQKFDLDAYENIPSVYFDICRRSFHVACFESLEESDCLAGESSARKGEKCDGNVSDTFKKCCKACKFGAELKTTTAGNCEISLRLSSDEVKNVTKRCCEAQDFDDFEETENNFYDSPDNSLESEAGKIDYLDVPAALIAKPKRTLKCFEHFCEDNKECRDSIDGPKCVCKSGFKENAGVCWDIDECALNLDSCSKNHKQCINTQGSFECQGCRKGFKEIQNYLSEDYEDDRICIDDNECLDNVCRMNEICTNIEGSYRCSSISCPDGYVFHNGTNCKLKTCHGRICHKTVSFIFKSVSPNDKTNEIYRFPKSKYEGYFKTDFFDINGDEKDDYVVRQKKPLQHDMKVILRIIHGRFEHKINIFIFVLSF